MVMIEYLTESDLEVFLNLLTNFDPHVFSSVLYTIINPIKYMAFPYQQHVQTNCSFQFISVANTYIILIDLHISLYQLLITIFVFYPSHAILCPAHQFYQPHAASQPAYESIPVANNYIIPIPVTCSQISCNSVYTSC